MTPEQKTVIDDAAFRFSIWKGIVYPRIRPSSQLPPLLGGLSAGVRVYRSSIMSFSRRCFTPHKVARLLAKVIAYNWLHREHLTTVGNDPQLS